MSEKQNSLSDEQKTKLIELEKERVRRGSLIEEPQLISDGIPVLDGEISKKYFALNKWYNEERRKILQRD